jgi:AcrR family transcriptional regulator
MRSGKEMMVQKQRPRLTKVRRTQLERSEATKQKLLDAAIKVMNERGYFGFTMSEAALQAGVTRGAQSHHFKSKDAFVLSAIENLYAKILMRTRQRALEQRNIANMLDPIVNDAKDFFTSPEFITVFDVLIAMSKSSLNRAVADISVQYRTPVENIWADYLIARGVSEELAHQSVWFVFSLVRGLAIRTAFKYDPKLWNDTLALGLKLLDAHLAKQAELGN